MQAVLVDRFAHYLRPAGSTKIPRTHLFLDVESVSELRNGVSAQHWRLACAELVTRDSRRGWTPPVRKFYATPLDLWADVHSLAKPGFRLVVWCHNLGYDLRVSDALRYLPAMRYDLEGIALDHVASWAKFTREGATILLVDSCSWLPAKLSKIAADLGTAQRPHPGPDASDELWRERCSSDVTILRRAIVECLDLVSGEDLGPWRPTGAGQSHSAWKRQFLTHRVLVHDDLECLEAERHAAWTGRCEAWRHGQQHDGPFTEYDLDLAYCQIAADSTVPAVLAGHGSSRDLDKLLVGLDRYAVNARIRVQTDVPVLPALHDERIIWPVGVFETTVWDPELRLAVAAGARVEVLQSWVYRTAPVLRDACQWIVDRLHAGAGPLTRVQLRMLKHWARAIVGRCALRYRTWEEWGTSEIEDVCLGMIHDWQTGDVREMMQVGSQLRVLTDQQESPESLPQIPGWIMSECRRRLWECMLVAGLDHVLYVDTDSLIVDQLGAQRLDRRLAAGGLWPMHIKGRYQQLDIHAPRILEVDGERRMSGIPLQARLDADGKLQGEIFLSLKESLVRHQISEVEVLRRTYAPATLDRRRVHLPDGATAPIVLPTSTAG